MLGLELRGRELSDALGLLDGVWERLSADQRIEAMLTIDDFEEAQAGPLPPLSGAGPAGNIATLRAQLEALEAVALSWLAREAPQPGAAPIRGTESQADADAAADAAHRRGKAAALANVQGVQEMLKHQEERARLAN